MNSGVNLVSTSDQATKAGKYFLLTRGNLEQHQVQIVGPPAEVCFNSCLLIVIKAAELAWDMYTAEI